MSSSENDRERVSTNLIVENQFEIAANLIGLEPSMQVLLKSPFRTVSVEVPVRMTMDGSKSTAAIAFNTMEPADHARAGCATTRKPTKRKC